MALIKSIIIWITCVCVILLMFPLNFIIWLLCLPFDKDRVILHWILVYEGMLVTRIISYRKIDIKGREKIIRGTTYIIITNHQSTLDTLLLNYLRFKFKWVSKSENIKVPVFGWYLRMADYIVVNRSNEESKVKMFEKSYRCLKNGISVLIFPEGTRSLNKEIGFFKRGAFQMALKAGVPILPVLIDGTGSILPKHGKIFNTSHQLRIRVLDPIHPAAFETDNPDVLAQKVHSLMTLGLKELRDRSNSR